MKYTYFNKYGYGFNLDNLYVDTLPTLKARKVAMTRDLLLIRVMLVIAALLTLVPLYETVTRGLPMVACIPMTIGMLMADFHLRNAMVTVIRGLDDVNRIIKNYYILSGSMRNEVLHPEKKVVNPFVHMKGHYGQTD